MSRAKLPIIITASLIFPVQSTVAQTAKTCSSLTDLNANGEITWSTNESVSELVADAQTLDISAKDYRSLCGEPNPPEKVAEEQEETSNQEKAETKPTEEKTDEEKIETGSSEKPEVEIKDLANAAEKAGGLGLAGTAGAVAAIAAAAGAGGGGSGGISDGTYRDTVSGSYLTEYNYQSMLSAINPLSLNDYGYTGLGVKVAVVDSGIHIGHAEFSGKTIYGYDFAGSATGWNDDENGHGTHVASIIAGVRDGNGMRGVAYDATLYSYKVDNDGDSGLEALTSDAQIAAVFNRHVTDNIQVSNNSWGAGSAITSYTANTLRSSYSSTIAAMRSAQQNGTLIVFAAGNDYRTQPDVFGAAPYLITELADEWLTVVAVNSSLTETNYTNRCGVAYNFCVTAPGGGDSSSDGILAAQANGSYTRMSGTSMAAPHVAGLAAALMEKFPSLTAAQIATRIKNTASLSGLTGSGGQTLSNSSTTVMRNIFGHGLVNATAAASRIGNFLYPRGDDLLKATDLSSTKLTLPLGLPNAAQDKILQSNFIVFDSFDGARFSSKGSEVFTKNQKTAVRSFSGGNQTDLQKFHETKFTNEGPINSLSMWSPRFISEGNVSNNSSGEAFWREKATLLSPSTFISEQQTKNFFWEQTLGPLKVQPFVQLVDKKNTASDLSAYGVSFNMRLSKNLSTVTGYKTGLQSLNNGIFDYVQSAGRLNEMEIGFIQKLSANDSIFGRYVHTDVEDILASNQTFGFEAATTKGWTIGYEKTGDFGSIAFGISKPNELNSGAATLITPTGRTKSGQILYASKKFDLNSENTSERFIAFRYDKPSHSFSIGIVEDRNRLGKIGAASLDMSFRF